MYMSRHMYTYDTCNQIYVYMYVYCCIETMVNTRLNQFVFSFKIDLWDTVQSFLFMINQDHDLEDKPEA